MEDGTTPEPTATKTHKQAKKKTKAKPRTNKQSVRKSATPESGKIRGRVAYPKNSLPGCLRIPQGILDQNAGNDCSDREAAAFSKIGWGGNLGVEISSAIKYGLLERASPGKIRPTELARRIIRPQEAKDRIEGLRQAVLKAPVIGDLYTRYRGENLPDQEFLANTLVDSFNIRKDEVPEFINTFIETLRSAQLLEEVGNGKFRVLDVTSPGDISTPVGEQQIKKLAKGITVSASDTCFVMMPFADPVGGYYKSIYEPAIEKAKLTAIRADADLYGTGKIVDQIWDGINSARVLVAELTGRNPNVLYELGIAHAIHKPVVLVCSNESDVPFDLRHVRVIYYEMRDPFWGAKLIEKVAENILSALHKPEEAVLFPRKWHAG
jgi:hypothetical protein